MKVYAVFMRYTAYERSYDSVDNALIGIYDSEDSANERMKKVADDKLAYLKEVYADYNMTSDIFFTDESFKDGYAELLVGDDEKYEYYIVTTELNEAMYDEL